MFFSRTQHSVERHNCGSLAYFCNLSYSITFGSNALTQIDFNYFDESGFIRVVPGTYNSLL